MDADAIGTSASPGPTVLVLASGRGERFLASGGQVHKLQALLAGQAVLQHTLAAVRASGLPWHLEDRGHPGMGDSIAAAVGATPDAEGWLILPGDLPLVLPESLLAVAQALARTSVQTPVVVPVVGGQKGHPVGFARSCGPALRALTGDQGAAAVVKAFGPQLLPLQDAGCVTDVDTVSALQAAQALWLARQSRQPLQPSMVTANVVLRHSSPSADHGGSQAQQPCGSNGKSR